MDRFPWLEASWVSDPVRHAFQSTDHEKLTLREDGTPVLQTTSPELMARMLCGLAVEPGMRVLEIGSGSGYNAALLREIVGTSGSIVTVEVDPTVAAAARERWAAIGCAGVTSVVGDGWDGHAPTAPSDRIIATCKPPRLPEPWIAQLSDGGILAVPLDLRGIPGATVVVYFRKTSDTLVESISLHRAGLIPMAPSPDEIVIEPWKRADAAVWSGAEREPALWLRLPGMQLSPPERLRLLGGLLRGGRAEPLPVPCASAWPFWVYVVVAGNIDDLLIASTAEGFDLPTNGFAFFDPDGSAAYCEFAATTSFFTFGQPIRSRERLLEAYQSWCILGQPGLDRLHIRVSSEAGGPTMEYTDGGALAGSETR
jgi:protein-L-isoaspartate(D-aspartate) O-methyltransferase